MKRENGEEKCRRTDLDIIIYRQQQRLLGYSFDNGAKQTNVEMPHTQAAGASSFSTVRVVFTYTGMRETG